MPLLLRDEIQLSNQSILVTAQNGLCLSGQALCFPSPTGFLLSWIGLYYNCVWQCYRHIYFIVVPLFCYIDIRNVCWFVCFKIVCLFVGLFVVFLDHCFLLWEICNDFLQINAFSRILGKWKKGQSQSIHLVQVSKRFSQSNDGSASLGSEHTFSQSLTDFTKQQRIC